MYATYVVCLKWLGCFSSWPLMCLKWATFWALLYKTYWMKSQKQCMWSPPLLLNLKGHDWRKKNASIWLWDRVSSWCQQGPARSAIFSNRLSLGADWCIKGHVSSFSVADIYLCLINTVLYHLWCQRSGCRKLPEGVLWNLASENWFWFCWGVVTHHTHQLWRECKSCVWFVSVSGPAELLFCW